MKKENQVINLGDRRRMRDEKSSLAWERQPLYEARPGLDSLVLNFPTFRLKGNRILEIQPLR